MPASWSWLPTTVFPSSTGWTSWLSSPKVSTALPGPGGRARRPGGGRPAHPLAGRAEPRGAVPGHRRPGGRARGLAEPALRRGARAGPPGRGHRGDRLARLSTRPTGTISSRSSTARSSPSSPRWPSTRPIPSLTSPTSRSTWWSGSPTPSPGTSRIARVKVPPVLPRFVSCPTVAGWWPSSRSSPPISMPLPGHGDQRPPRFRVTRNADSVHRGRGRDRLAAVELELHRRRFGQAVRLEVAAAIPPDLLDMLVEEVGVPADSVLLSDVPVDLSGLRAVGSIDRPDLRSPLWTPVVPAALADWRRQFFSVAARATTSSSTTLTSPSPPRSRHSCRWPPTTRTCWPSSRPSTASAATARSTDALHPASLGRQGGHRGRRAPGPLRRAGQHRPGPRPRGSGRAGGLRTAAAKDPLEDAPRGPAGG